MYNEDNIGKDDSMSNKRERFEKRETWMWRIHLGLAIGALFSVGLLVLIEDQLRDVAPWLSQIYVVVFFASLLVFVISVFQLLQHLFRNRKWPEPPRIWRSVVTLFTSPVVSLTYYVVLFVLLLSMASCEYSG
jgi:magnesium-transporting ATPase (P-type)